MALTSSGAALSRLGGSSVPEPVRRALCGQVRLEETWGLKETLLKKEHC